MNELATEIAKIIPALIEGVINSDNKPNDDKNLLLIRLKIIIDQLNKILNEMQKDEQADKIKEIIDFNVLPDALKWKIK